MFDARQSELLDHQSDMVAHFLPQVAFRDIVERDQRSLDRQFIPESQPQDTLLLAGAHRGYKPRDDLHLRIELVVSSAWDRDVQALRKPECETLGVTLPHPDIGNLLVRGVHLPGLIEAESIVEK